MSRRRTVAWAEIESPRMRQWRQMATGTVTKDDERGRRTKTGVYWCGVDRPITDDSLCVSPVYTVTKVPEDAECTECGIRIRDLQEMFQ